MQIESVEALFESEPGEVILVLVAGALLERNISEVIAHI